MIIDTEEKYKILKSQQNQINNDNYCNINLSNNLNIKILENLFIH